MINEMKKIWDKVLFFIYGLALIAISVREYLREENDSFWFWSLVLLVGIIYIVIGVLGFRRIWRTRKLKRKDEEKI